MKKRCTASALSTFGLILAACSGAPTDGYAAQQPDAAITQNGAHPAQPLAQAPFTLEEAGRFDEPWAMVFLPNSKQALVTEKGGQLKLWQQGAAIRTVSGVPAVHVAGQGGLGDIILAPDYAQSGMIYLSWAEAGSGGTAGAAVGRARLVLDGEPRLEGLTVIWRQQPKVSGSGHYSHRLVFSPDGRYLFIGSGDRQKFDPAQDMAANLGKILRLNPDGSVPSDNPFVRQGAGQSKVGGEIWSLGHRNILGLAFDDAGRLWNQEMGPRGGDEVNLVERAANYGYPLVSNGDHYDGRDIPDHHTRPEFAAPKLWWNPAISPAGLSFYTGDMYKGWKNSLLMGALSGQGLIRMTIDGDRLSKAERWDLGMRIREVEVRDDGSIWLLSDGKTGKLFRMVPKD